MSRPATVAAAAAVAAADPFQETFEGLQELCVASASGPTWSNIAWQRRYNVIAKVDPVIETLLVGITHDPSGKTAYVHHVSSDVWGKRAFADERREGVSSIWYG